MFGQNPNTMMSSFLTFPAPDGPMMARTSKKEVVNIYRIGWLRGRKKIKTQHKRGK
jgi:hypothetical protein